MKPPPLPPVTVRLPDPPTTVSCPASASTSSVPPPPNSRAAGPESATVSAPAPATTVSVPGASSSVGAVPATSSCVPVLPISVQACEMPRTVACALPLICRVSAKRTAEVAWISPAPAAVAGPAGIALSASSRETSPLVSEGSACNTSAATAAASAAAAEVP
jgi:hypothetical protein